MTHEQCEILRLAGSILRGKDADFSLSSYEGFVFNAKSCDVLNILYPKVSSCLSDRVNQMCRTIMMKSALAEENILFEFSRICKAAEENSLFILALKGIYTRNYYPDPGCRQMVDIDLLYDYSQRHKIIKMMKSLGFNDVKYTIQHTKWYNPVSRVTVEMHNSMHDEGGLDKSFYSDLLKRIVPLNHFKNIYRMSDNDNYIYTLAHLYRHYCQNSAAMKQLTDLYVLQLYAGLSYSVIEKEIKFLGIDDFYKKIRGIIEKLFDSGGSLSQDEEYIADIIAGNSFHEEESGSDIKIIKILKTLFPKPSKIYVCFPYVNKRKWLLPLGYILRIVRCLKSDKKFIIEKIK